MEEVKAIKPKAGDASPTHANLGAHHSSIIALVQLLARHARKRIIATPLEPAAAVHAKRMREEEAVESPVEEQIAMRVAIYARYSSDLQSRASIEDQIRLAREHAVRQGWSVAEIYTDYGISGASMHRPGLQALLADAPRRKFDVILSEALDRISRDQGDTANIHKRMRFHGISIYTLSEGLVDMIQVGFKGMMNQMFLTELAAKVRRGQRGRVENGKVTAGLGYGYEVVRAFDDRGQPVRGERRVKPGEAKIVVRIFREYVAGRSAKAIANDLNRDGVRSPSGKGWTYSSLLGTRQRGTGILNNEMYVGRITWNRVREDRDPPISELFV